LKGERSGSMSGYGAYVGQGRCFGLLADFHNCLNAAEAKPVCWWGAIAALALTQDDAMLGIHVMRAVCCVSLPGGGLLRVRAWRQVGALLSRRFVCDCMLRGFLGKQRERKHMIAERKAQLIAKGEWPPS
jgi:hypothetical protein